VGASSVALRKDLAHVVLEFCTRPLTNDEVLDLGLEFVCTDIEHQTAGGRFPSVLVWMGALLGVEVRVLTC
jgi:hypothetical protein